MHYAKHPPATTHPHKCTLKKSTPRSPCHTKLFRGMPSPPAIRGQIREQQEARCHPSTGPPLVWVHTSPNASALLACSVILRVDIHHIVP